MLALGFWCSKVISVHVQHVYFYFYGHDTCLFSNDSQIMIYTPNYLNYEVCHFKSTHFDSASQACTMVDVHSNSANRCLIRDHICVL